MERVDRPAVDTGPDNVSSRLFTLDQRIVIALAHRLDVREIEEQLRVALMLDLVVGNGSARVMPVTQDDDAPTPLAGVVVSKESLPAYAMRTTPALILVEVPVLSGFRTAARHVSIRQTASD